MLGGVVPHICCREYFSLRNDNYAHILPHHPNPSTWHKQLVQKSGVSNFNRRFRTSLSVKHFEWFQYQLFDFCVEALHLLYFESRD